jgi:hypothetical protein
METISMSQCGVRVRRSWKDAVLYLAIPLSLMTVVGIAGFAGFVAAVAFGHKMAGAWGAFGLGFAAVLLPLQVAVRVNERVRHWPKRYEVWGDLCFCIVACSLPIATLLYAAL